MTKTTVLIAARNEAELIGQTLARLDNKTTEPVVIVNDTHDETAEIARQTGATVLETATAGKLAAIQLGLKSLGASALEPLIITDADTYPVFPRRWVSAMTAPLNDEVTVASGLYIARGDESLLNRTVLSGLRVANVITKIVRDTPHASGANMSLNIRTQEKLDEILSMANYWPGEDLALVDMLSDGSPERHKIIINPHATARTSSRYLPALSKIVLGGRQATLEAVAQDRADRSQGSCVPYVPEYDLLQSRRAV